ncbi:hypothetical protein TWF281_004847 [Arthrobotrys megalospora]
MASLSLLPSEIIFQILGHIDAFTAIHVVRRVSKRFRILSDATYPHMHGLPVSVWIGAIPYLKTTLLPNVKKVSRSFNNLVNFMIENDKLPYTHYGNTPVSPKTIHTARIHQPGNMHPFLYDIQFWHKHWRRCGGRRGVAETPNLLFECATGLPVDRLIVALKSVTISAMVKAAVFPDGDTRRFQKLVLRKRRRHRVITNLDVMVAVDEMLGQGVNEICIQVRDGILCASRTAEEFGRHVGKVYLGSVDEEIEYIDDLIGKDGFLRRTAESRPVFGTTFAEFWSIGRRPGKWKTEDAWLVMYARRADT